MKVCSIIKKIVIVSGDMGDYKKLSHYHYRSGELVTCAKVFAMRLGRETVGVIVYTMPAPGLELRSLATDGFFTGFDRKTQMSLVNKNIRCIGRVVIEPRFRGLGLASKLVRETMAKMDKPIIESMAVMGRVNPFFEKAGMKAYSGPTPVRCSELVEAFSLIGIEKEDFLMGQEVHNKIENLSGQKAEFIERQIKKFLQSDGRKRSMQPSLERTEYVLSKLTDRPIYYIWFNPNIGLITD